MINAMQRRIANVYRLIGLTLLAWTGLANADTQHWVVVGSYSTLGQAERGRELLGERLIEPLFISSTQADGLPRYRVLAGPFEDPVAAAGARGSAQGAGIVDAWILRTEDDAALGLTDPVPADSSSDWSGGLGYDDWSSADWRNDDELSATQEPLTRRETSERTLVEQAPDDYQLHRLKRE